MRDNLGAEGETHPTTEDEFEGPLLDNNNTIRRARAEEGARMAVDVQKISHSNKLSEVDNNVDGVSESCITTTTRYAVGLLLLHCLHIIPDVVDLTSLVNLEILPF